jgi:hypothetical protein
MESAKQLDKRRMDILSQMAEIASMRKGAINEQYVPVKHKNGETVKKGPYFVLTKKEPGGKTLTRSIPADKIGFVREEAEKYKLFRRLSDEYIEVCEQLSIMSEGTSRVTDEHAKKNGRS